MATQQRRGLIAAGKAAPCRWRRVPVRSSRRPRSRRHRRRPAPAGRAAGDSSGFVGGHPVPDAGERRRGAPRARDRAAPTTGDDCSSCCCPAARRRCWPCRPRRLAGRQAERPRTRCCGPAPTSRAEHRAQTPVRASRAAGWRPRPPGARDRLAISDVVGDDLGVIASGPTVADPSTYAGRAGACSSATAGPAAIHRRRRRAIEQARAAGQAETPKPGSDPRLARGDARHRRPRDAMTGRGDEARARGYHVDRRSTSRSWAKPPRRAVLDVSRDVRGRRRAARGRSCLVSSGETTVRYGHRQGRPQPGIRARAGELPLRAQSADGGRGQRRAPTASTARRMPPGRSSTPRHVSRARAAGLGRPEPFLTDNNAYAFFGPRRSHQDGPTGTNVGDIQIALFRCQSLNSDASTAIRRDARQAAAVDARRRSLTPHRARELHAALKIPARRARDVPPATAGARRRRRARQIAASRVGAARQDGSRRRPPADAPGGYGFVVPEPTPTRPATSTFPAAASTRRCTATASSCASSAARTSGRREGRIIRILERGSRDRRRPVRPRRRPGSATSCRSTARHADICRAARRRRGEPSPATWWWCEITRWPTATRGPVGRVAEVLGDIDAPGVDTRSSSASTAFPTRTATRRSPRRPARAARCARATSRAAPTSAHTLDRHHRRRARARLRRRDHAREAAERQLSGSACTSPTSRTTCTEGSALDEEALRARHVGVLPRARRAHVPGGAGDRACAA